MGATTGARRRRARRRARRRRWIEVLARGVVRSDRSASSYPICLSLPATQVCHIWSARCNASQQDGFTSCFFGKVQSTELEFVAEATVQRGCVVTSFCSSISVCSMLSLSVTSLLVGFFVFSELMCVS